MPIATDRYVVITGGPGAGKTTLIDALERTGHARSIEAGRGVIQDQQTIGGSALPWINPAAFAEAMLGWELRSHHLAAAQSGVVFFDRGVPDIAGYLRLVGLPVPAHIEAACRRFRYNRRVFVAPPWAEIFTRDAERKQTPEEAVRTYEALRATYPDYGYDLIELPRVPVEARVRFVLDQISARSP